MRTTTKRLRRFAAAAACLAAAQASVADERSGAPDYGALTEIHQACGGEDCGAVLRGLIAFGDRRLAGLGGNGRACADCHMPANHFQLSPAAVEARFKLLEWRRRWNPNADDPLFRPIDADDFRINGQQARDFRNLRENGLIRIPMPLPANIRLVDPVTGQPTADTVADVWRAVPTVRDVALTGPDGRVAWPREPNVAGGYQLDARFGTLQEQALAALQVHAEITRLPAPRLLDDLAAFQRVLFTNHRVRKLAAAVEAGVTPLPDADPPLTNLEQQGKAVFGRACAQCHGGPGQSTPQAPVSFRFHDIFTQCPRPVDTVTPARFAFKPCPERLARNARTYEITLPDGTKQRRTSSDPGRALLTGFVGGPPPLDDWNKLDTPGLRGLRHTAPYFHNNSADTLEEVVDHYVAFFAFLEANRPPNAPPPPIASTDGVRFDRKPTPEELPALLAYLRRL